MRQDLEFVKINMKLHLDINAYSLAIQCLKLNDAILPDGKIINGDLKAELLMLLTIELHNLEHRLNEVLNATN